MVWVSLGGMPRPRRQTAGESCSGSSHSVRGMIAL